MKLTVRTQTLTEAVTQIEVAKTFQASMLKDNKMMTEIAKKVQAKGFPNRFSIKAELSTGSDLVLEYEIYEKNINDNVSYHEVTFTYEFTRDTEIKTRALLKAAEPKESDDDEVQEKYDALYDDLKHSEIHITAEFTDEFGKVWASVK